VTDDSVIRQRFADLREEESARVPEFEQVLRRRRPGRYTGLRAIAAGAFLVLVAATVIGLLVPHGRAMRAPDAAAPSLAQWRAPTDFLLDTPGRELLQAIPHIGESLSGDFTALPERKSISPRPTGQEPQS
jgi:hypothetical protein